MVILNEANMEKRDNSKLITSCRCGKVYFETSGTPIMTVACYCNSCREAGQQLETRPEAPAILEADGSTHYVMCRKDRVHCQQGHDLLREHRLTPESTTRRVVATCCNSAMFLEFISGHWLSLYKNRFDQADQLPIEMRTMTVDRRAGVEFSDNIPSPEKHSIQFMWKLLSAWVTMGFKTPKIDYVGGKLDG